MLSDNFAGRYIYDKELEEIIKEAVEAESERWEEAIFDSPLRIEIQQRVGEIREGK